MTELAHLKAIEAELSTSDDSEQTTPVHDRPEVLQAAANLANVTRMAIDHEELVARCQSYEADITALTQRCDSLEQRLHDTTTERDFYRTSFFSGTRAAEAIERIVTQWRVEAHAQARSRPNKSVSPPDDSDPVPSAGKPWRNLRVLPTAQDITQFAPNRIRR